MDPFTIFLWAAGGALLGLFAASALAPDVQQGQGGTKVTKPATDEFVQVVFGKRGRVKGIIALQDSTEDTTGDDIPYDLMHCMVVWSVGPIGSMGTVYYDDDPIDSARFAAGATGRWAFTVAFNDGTNAYTDPLLEQAGYDPARHKFTKLALSYDRLEWDGDGEAFSRFPNITRDINSGYLCRTPHDDSYVSTSNPIIILWELLRNTEFGAGADPVTELDRQSFIDAFDTHNVTVPNYDGAGPTEVRVKFTCNWVMDPGKELADNIETLLASFRAHLPEINGKLTLIVEDDDPAESFELIEGETFFGDVETNDGDVERFTRVIAEFDDEDTWYKTNEVSWPVKDSALHQQWVAENGGIHNEKRIKLPTKTNFYEAQHDVKQFAMVARESLTCGLTAIPDAATAVHCGQIHLVTRPSVGWVQKPFRVLHKRIKSDLNVDLTLREHQPYIYQINEPDAKPPIPDTTNTFTRPDAPTNITFTPVYDGLAQIEIAWVSDAPRFQLQIYRISTGENILTTEVRTNSYRISNLDVADYELDIRAIDNWNTSSVWVENVPFSLVPAVTPTDPPDVFRVPGAIYVKLIEPASPLAFYEWAYNTADNQGTATEGPNGRTIQLTPVISEQTYYFWYRLVTLEGKGNWVQLVVTNAIEQTLYTWTAYADDDTGTGISVNPTGKQYIGFSGGHTVATVDVSDPSIFTWLRNGASNWYTQSGVPAGNLGVVGDKYLNTDNGDIYEKTGFTTWTLTGNLSPGDGDKWLSGSGAPSVGLGNDGDWYINLDNYNLYQKVAGAWVANGNIKGTDGTDGADGQDGDQGPQGPQGPTGPQGVQGPPGADGTPRYTWIRYADNASGSGISNSPTGKEYIGFAHNKTTATESSNPADYSWSLIVGPEGPQGNTGIPGPPGDDGTPRYIWVKYAANSTGSSGFSDVPLSNTEYIGIAPNKTSASESSNPADYVWSLFKGQDGQDGDTGPVGPIGPPGPEGPEADVTIISDDGNVTLSTSGSWSTICSVSLPAGTYEYAVSCRAVFEGGDGVSATVEIQRVYDGSTVVQSASDNGISASTVFSFSAQNTLSSSRVMSLRARLTNLTAGSVFVRSASGFITCTEL